ncbi:hypothetical protein COS31_02000 [Candidatus Roizmanbacteria bacterium CG02_land_8_20_14_3_00_36_15]|uniref:Dockerin domain-containing protein n=2 Tax=Candidatus Roizmaniibacteriota TaxID=1752723 RepID=A0A2M8KM25_9BACT|nr:MAG: hypothetical protein COS51_04860 [Candidatus Roizmanbacteria bacterium CG03_land_8_20_14_0_80_36_21]PIV37953.1 MAG: hypothetical protein COS31_02000 [Candidatus Roizmanbacteria bacterium CG02_land_8_20_14_3_00_36_15]PIY69623.1 MAG: hypothetical protein COY89_05440 [Candidatus Roizmanbacteria bacterium CG_4_10_14_0_8_um_filter_36_36]PJA52586.1 MAG: hypothetical protein CO166_05210 [Candidatus Roizmanbacteria bacterium CG_4_9_14_3_um_filter_36_11]PJC81533.1 MAG: hypothetical protein CO007
MLIMIDNQGRPSIKNVLKVIVIVIVFFILTTSNLSAVYDLHSKGDADGNGIINTTDYFYYVAAVMGGKIPATVNPDFNDDGEVGASDRAIIIETLNQPSLQPTPTPTPFTLVNKKMVFAEKYRSTIGSATNEFVSLGYYEFLANGVAKIHSTIFDGKSDVPPTKSAKKHGAMDAPYAPNATCVAPINTSINKPTAKSNNDFVCSWEVIDNILKVRIGTVTHEWRLVDQTSFSYRINKDLIGSGTNVYSETDGFGYLTDSVSSEKIFQSNLLDYYRSELMQNVEPNDNPWTYFQTSLSSTVFKPTTDPNVVSYSHAAPFTGHKKMWGETSILFNDAPSSNLMIFINGGHDYNENGCLDETGHSQQMLGVKEGDKITKMVGIEYSWETDGYPILSILRYYKPNTSSNVSIKLVSPPIPDLTKGQTYTLAWTSTNAPPGAYVGNIQLFKVASSFLNSSKLPCLPQDQCSGSSHWISQAIITIVLI